MLALLSPATRLDFETPLEIDLHTQPQLMDESARLMDRTRQLSHDDIRGLMKLSDTLVKLNHERYGVLTTELDLTNARQAVFAFRGDVYRGLDVDSWSEDDLAFAQDHLGILSGLYGYLRPMDLMQPYRLEMGTRLSTDRGKNLYAFWGDRITARIHEALAGHDDNTIVQLASNEYFKSVKADQLPSR